jgi:hypothetical protein
MPYLVKWKLTGSSRTYESPVAYPVPSAAIDFACTQLKHSPSDIWIEGPGGVRIERAVIFRGCQDRQPQIQKFRKGAPA